MQIRVCLSLMLFSLTAVCLGEERDGAADAKAVRKQFACLIYADAAGFKVIETAKQYGTLREQVTEITFPEPGVRRAESRMLRPLGEFDFMRDRLVLIWNTSMADEIQIVAASGKEIRVRNRSTGGNAIAGSAQLIALAVPRGKDPPRVKWIGKAPQGRIRPKLPLPPADRPPRKK